MGSDMNIRLDEQAVPNPTTLAAPKSLLKELQKEEESHPSAAAIPRHVRLEELHAVIGETSRWP